MASSIPKAQIRTTLKEGKCCNICGKQIYKKEEWSNELEQWIVIFDNRYICDESYCADEWNKRASGDENMPGYINLF